MERYHMFRLGFAIIFYAVYCIRPMVVYGLKTTNAAENNKTINLTDEEYFVYYQGVQGKPGIDFPVLSHIPRTTFNCRGIESGYYADLETDCQVFHICADGKKISFLCPNGTIFDQAELICEWWFKVNCSSAPNLYEGSAELLREVNARRKLSRKVGKIINKNVEPSNEQQKSNKNIQFNQNKNNNNYYNNYNTPSNRNNNNNNLSSKKSLNNKNDVTEREFKLETAQSNYDNYRNSYQNQENLLSNTANPKTLNQQSVRNKSNREGSRFRVADNLKQTSSPTSTEKSNSFSYEEVNFKKSDLKENDGGNRLSKNTEQRIYNIYEGKVTKEKSKPKSDTTSLSRSNNNNNQKVKSEVKQFSQKVQNQSASNSVKLNKSFNITTSRQSNSFKNFNQNNDKTQQTLVSGNSGESQITQETASFYKNSFSSINTNNNNKAENNKKYSNHRETYSEIKDPNNYSTKIFSTLASVTPQYITTQPINNGRPFLGSQVGGSGVTFNFAKTINPTTNRPYTTFADLITNTKSTFQTLPPKSTITDSDFFTKDYYLTEQTYEPEVKNLYQTNNKSKINESKYVNIKIKPLENNQFVVGRGKISKNTSLKLATTVSLGNNSNKLFNTGSSATLNSFSTLTIPKTTRSPNVTPPKDGSFNIGKGFVKFSNTVNNLKTTKITTTTTTPINTTSKPILDYATVFGRFKETTTTTTTPTTPKYSTTRSVFSSSTRTTPNPLKIDYDDYSFSQNLYSTTKPSFTPFSTNSNKKITQSNLYFTTPKPIFTTPLKPKSTTNIPNKRTSYVTSNYYFSSPITSSSTTPTSFNKGTEFTSFNYFTTPKPIISTKTTPTNFNKGNNYASSNFYYSTTPNPNTFKFDDNTKGFFVTKSETKPFIYTTKTTPPPPTTTTTTTTTTNPSTFKTSKFNTVSKETKLLKPRPFQLPSLSTIKTTTTTTTPPRNNYKNNYYNTDNYKSLNSLNTIFPTYKISTASPFSLVTTPSTTYSTKFDEFKSNINPLKGEVENFDNSGETPRPGLIIPPSAGPQTLHTLAVYFANALDEIVDDSDTYNVPMDKEKLTELLTQMTMNRYNELFKKGKDGNGDGDGEGTTTTITTTTTNTNNQDSEDLVGQHSKNPVQSSKIRQLARIFTQALSSYLDDPETFKRVLQEVRPTEPHTESETTEIVDDELLNFSDADSKFSFPPIFPTIPTAVPTWNYLVAYNTTTNDDDNNNNNNIEVGNDLNSDTENLFTADSQSLVSQYNKIKDKSTSQTIKPLPDDHWTTSSGATKLWQSTFSFNPANINENLDTTDFTDNMDTTTDSLNLSSFDDKNDNTNNDNILNTTQIHKILTKFMNTTNSNDRFQRIIRKLNTTEREFLLKMQEIEANPVTRRLILLFISECSANGTQEAKAVPLHTLVSRETLQLATSNNRNNINKNNNSKYYNRISLSTTGGEEKNKNTYIQDYIEPGLDTNDKDLRALQLLNSLYTVASKFSK